MPGRLGDLDAGSPERGLPDARLSLEQEHRGEKVRRA